MILIPSIVVSFILGKVSKSYYEKITSTCCLETVEGTWDNLEDEMNYCNDDGDDACRFV